MIDRKILIGKIRGLMKTSGMEDETKSLLDNLLDAMDLSRLKKIYKSLSKEHTRLSKISEKEKRVKFKYQVMVEKLCDFELDEDGK